VTEKERNLARMKNLVSTHAISTQELDTAQAAYDRAVASLDSARADVSVAEADLKLNETNLAKAYIRSPIDGVVLTRTVEPGQTVASSLQAPVLFSIAEDLKKMELQVDVDEADVGKVRVGQRASFNVDAYPDRAFPATIRDIRFASETIQGVVTYKAVLDIDNSELLLRPGMTATAEIKVTELKDALLIPNAGLRYMPTTNSSAESRSFLSRLLPGRPRFRASSPQEQTGRDRTVWMLRNGEPAQVKVRIGSSDGKRTEIQSGELTAGDKVIVDQTANKQ
jgi:HlyD family secretion protein